MSPSKILFELSGSIAAWKACAVISRLVQDGHEVQTVATPAALRFVGAATLEGLTGRPVRYVLDRESGEMQVLARLHDGDAHLLVGTLRRCLFDRAGPLTGRPLVAETRQIGTS